MKYHTTYFSARGFKALSGFFFLAFSLLFLWSCKENPYEQGEVLYEYHCASCHMSDGSGLGALIPPLADSDYWVEHQQDIPCIIRHGLVDTIIVNGKTYNQPMAGIASLKPVMISNIINFINYNWYDEDTFVAPQEVETLLEGCN